MEQALTRAIRTADVVVISDYGSRLITPESWRRAFTAAKRSSPPLVLVDSRYGLTGFAGLTACTPNESEVEALLGVRIGDDREILERAGRTLLGTIACRAVLVTRGSRGMALFQAGAPTDHIPIVGSDQVTDVTGAGDTVIATFALALATGASFADAARVANHAGGIVVMKRGTATVTPDELIASLEDGSERLMGEVLTEAELIARVAEDRRVGRTVAFANGCFDVLHVGHSRYLAGSREQGDRLIVAINDDGSVRALKGADRPILPAATRAELVAALRVVDYVVVFPDDDG